MPKTGPDAVSDPTKLPVPGSSAAGIAAVGVAVCCMLPWYSFELGAAANAMGDAMRGMMGGGAPGFGGMGDALGNMMGSMGVSGTVVADGVGSWTGVVALIASAVAAVLTFAEPSGVLPWHRRSVLMVGCGLTAIAAALVLYGLSLLGGPVSISYGLLLAVLLSIASVVLSVRRLQAYGWLQQAAA